MKINGSIMKWVGSKRLMLDRLFKHVPNTGDVLIEPFAGSCNVALNSNYNRYLLNDANADLMKLYQLARDEPHWLIGELKVLFNGENNSAPRYYQFRRIYNKSTNERQRAVLLMYLSRHSYNGLVRYSAKSGFNVPFGSYKAPYLPEAEILFFSEKMANAEFYSMDFEPFLEMASKVSGEKVCYVDPPYLPLSNGKKVFVEYVAGGFPTHRHKDINDVLFRNKDVFSTIRVSNHSSKMLDVSYPNYIKKSTFRVPRTISQSGGDRNPAKEVILYY